MYIYIYVYSRTRIRSTHWAPTEVLGGAGLVPLVSYGLAASVAHPNAGATEGAEIVEEESLPADHPDLPTDN